MFEVVQFFDIKDVTELPPELTPFAEPQKTETK